MGSNPVGRAIFLDSETSRLVKNGLGVQACTIHWPYVAPRVSRLGSSPDIVMVKSSAQAVGLNTADRCIVAQHISARPFAEDHEMIDAVQRDRGDERFAATVPPA